MADFINDIINEQQAEYEKVLHDLELELYSFIDSPEAQDIELLETRLTQLLTVSGFYMFADNIINNIYQELAENSFFLYTEKPLFTEQDITSLNILKEQDLSKYTRYGEDLNNILIRSIDQYNKGFINKTVLMEIIKDTVSGDFRNYVKTWIGTSLSSFYRQTTLVLGLNAGFTKFKYVGKLIETSREFCRKHIGQIKTIAEWNSLDNEQGLYPISDYLGGWNCQHRLVGVA